MDYSLAENQQGRSASKNRHDSDSDTDFQAHHSDADAGKSEDDEPEVIEAGELADVQQPKDQQASRGILAPSSVIPTGKLPVITTPKKMPFKNLFKNGLKTPSPKRPSHHQT